MVTDEKIDPCRNRGLEGPLARIDGRADFSHVTVVFHLEPIVGPAEILDRGAARAFITKSDYIS
jgi:hypothetical protein